MDHITKPIMSKKLQEIQIFKNQCSMNLANQSYHKKIPSRWERPFYKPNSHPERKCGFNL